MISVRSGVAQILEGTTQPNIPYFISQDTLNHVVDPSKILVSFREYALLKGYWAL